MKRMLFGACLLLAAMVVSPEELLYTVAEPVPYGNNADKHVGDLQKTERIHARNSLRGQTQMIWFTKDGNEYLTDVKSLVPTNTHDLFSADIMPLLSTEKWVPVYYCDVLESKQRSTLVDFEPGLIRHNGPGDGGFYMDWYDYDDFYDIASGDCMFYNAAIHLGLSNSFAVKNIVKTDWGYAVACIESTQNDNSEGPTFDWPLSDGNQFITLLLYLDGEYLDMYINDTAHKFGTLVRVKEEFITQYQSLIHDNTCDLARVQWPQRSAKNIEIGKTYTTVENLSLRATESRDSETIATLSAMTAVQVLEKGAEDTIDSIKANWVKVRLGDGTEGWCFGGYLMPIVELPVAAQEAAVTEETPEVAAESGESVEPETEREISAAAAPQKAPLPWFIIGGGVLVLAGGGVLFLARKRKGRG